MPTRHQYYAMIHIGANRLGYVDEADYRAWLESLTGKCSAKECTLDELAALISALRACNALDDPRLTGIKGGRGRGDRPTDAQWRMANGLCRQLGMSGCDDPRFAAFAKRIARTDLPRFLTRKSMQSVIVGLVKWLERLNASG